MYVFIYKLWVIHKIILFLFYLFLFLLISIFISTLYHMLDKRFLQFDVRTYYNAFYYNRPPAYVVCVTELTLDIHILPLLV